MHLVPETGEPHNFPIYIGHIDQRYGPSTYSQHGEDLLIVNLLSNMGIEQPCYIDIGAHHPTRISNTALLYSRGSKGVNVEPNRHLIHAFEQMRPRDTMINAAVAPRSGNIEFFMFDDWSGRNTCDAGTAMAFVEESGRQLQTSERVEAITLNYLLNTFPCDFLNIDVEGLDYKIIQATTFTPGRSPTVICVEAQTTNAFVALEKLLDSKGYRVLIRMGCSVIAYRVIF